MTIRSSFYELIALLALFINVGFVLFGKILSAASKLFFYVLWESERFELILIFHLKNLRCAVIKLMK